MYIQERGTLKTTGYDIMKTEKLNLICYPNVVYIFDGIWKNLWSFDASHVPI